MEHNVGDTIWLAMRSIWTGSITLTKYYPKLCPESCAREYTIVDIASTTKASTGKISYTYELERDGKPSGEVDDPTIYPTEAECQSAIDAMKGD